MTEKKGRKRLSGSSLSGTKPGRSEGAVKKKTNKLWPQGKDRISLGPGWPELNPEEYKEAGRYFTEEQFQQVREVILPFTRTTSVKDLYKLNALEDIVDPLECTIFKGSTLDPFEIDALLNCYDLNDWNRRIKESKDYTPENFILRRLQRAVYKYHVLKLELPTFHLLPHTNKKTSTKLKKKGDEILDRMKDFETYLVENEGFINLSTFNPSLLYGILDQMKIIQDVISIRYNKVVNNKRAWNKNWHYFLAGDVIPIWETLVSRPKYSRVSEIYKNAYELYGPFLDFSRESLKLINIEMSEEAIVGVLKKYRIIQKDCLVIGEKPCLKTALPRRIIDR